MDVTTTAERYSPEGTSVHIGEIVSVDEYSPGNSSHPRMILIHILGIPEVHGEESFNKFKELIEQPIIDPNSDDGEWMRNCRWRFLAENIGEAAYSELLANNEFTIDWNTAKAFLVQRSVIDKDDPSSDILTLITDGHL